MHLEKKHKLKQLGVVIGIGLSCVPVGIPWFYGNLSLYTNSYLIMQAHMSQQSTGSMWLETLYVAGYNTGTLISGVLVQRLWPRLTNIIGMLMLDLSMCLSYFAVQNNLWALNISLGFVCGVAGGFLLSMALVYAKIWLPQRVGLATSVAYSAIGVGGVLFTELTTDFINPHNVKPDFKYGNSIYFSQPDVITRTPWVFIIVGGLDIAFHVVSLFLLRNHPDFETNFRPWRTEHHHSSHGLTTLNGEVETNGMVKNTYSSLQESAKQVMKMPSFYALTLAIALVSIGYLVLTNYYKQFGISYIKNDFFISSVGVAVNVTVIISRLLWGALLDKIDINLILIVYAALQTLQTVFWYFIPGAGKWPYLLWTVAIQGVQSGSSVIPPIAVLKGYGSQHCVTNYGILRTIGSVIYLGFTPFAEIILHDLGWFWLFFLTALANALALVMCTFLPRYSQ